MASMCLRLTRFISRPITSVPNHPLGLRNCDAMKRFSTIATLYIRSRVWEMKLAGVPGRTYSPGECLTVDKSSASAARLSRYPYERQISGI